MPYSIRRLGDTHELELTDSFTVSDKSIIRVFTQILEHVEGESCILFLDKLERLDFCGLELLILMGDLASSKGVELSLRSPRYEVREMFGVTGVDRLISVHM